MRILGESSEDEMIFTFLHAELRSERFGAKLREALDSLHFSPTLIEHADLSNAAENAARLRLLSAFRGYGQNQGLFEHFPANVRWQHVALTPAELLRVKYISYSYWNELSNGTRLPTEAAKTIRAGRVVFGVPNDRFLHIANVLQGGHQFPPLIVVRAAEGTDLVVLEGHVRLTVYALVPNKIPDEAQILLGTAPVFTNWFADQDPAP